MTPWVKHSFGLKIPLADKDQLEDLRDFIPALAQDARDALSDVRFGAGNWQKGELIIDYTIHEQELDVLDDDGKPTGETFIAYCLLAKGFVWGPRDDE